jgi:hypothetical protein
MDRVRQRRDRQNQHEGVALNDTNGPLLFTTRTVLSAGQVRSPTEYTPHGLERRGAGRTASSPQGLLAENSISDVRWESA